MFSSKKADESFGISLKTLIGMVLVAIAIGMLFIFISKVQSGIIFDQKFLTSDLGLLIDTISNPSGNLVVDYPRDTRQLAIEIKDSNIAVFNPSLFDPFKQTYDFTQDKSIDYENKELIPDEGKSIVPRFVKQGSKIKIHSTETNAGESGKLACALPENKESLRQKGSLITVLPEIIADASELDDSKLKEKVKGADVSVLILSSDNFDERINPINGYVSLSSKKIDESKYLACLVMNLIFEDKEIKQKLSERKIPEFILQKILLTDRYEILADDKISIVLEIGNSWNTNDYFTSDEFRKKFTKLTDIAIDEYG